MESASNHVPPCPNHCARMFRFLLVPRDRMGGSVCPSDGLIFLFRNSYNGCCHTQRYFLPVGEGNLEPPSLLPPGSPRTHSGPVGGRQTVIGVTLKRSGSRDPRTEPGRLRFDWRQDAFCQMSAHPRRSPSLRGQRVQTEPGVLGSGSSTKQDLISILKCFLSVEAPALY